MSNAMVPTKEARDTLVAAVAKWKPWIMKVLPRHVTPERMFKVINLAMTRQPALWACDQQSVIQSVLTAAQLGLDVGGALGSAYLVPFKGKCTLIIGYRGLIDLARRSGQILTIEAHVVHEGEDFDVVYGSEPKLTHRPSLSGEPGEMLGAYAVAFLRDGGKQSEFMTTAQINGIRKRSPAGGGGPWVTDYEEMARKTVVRRLCKYLPLTPEMQRAYRADDLAAEGEAPDMDFDVDVEPQAELAPVTTIGAAQDAAAKVAARVREKQAKDMQALPRADAPATQEREPGDDDPDAA